ncbi:MAG: Na/Pi cotransporter family protein [Caloramator sp.]|uniref:Na/Pi cotransporter family protein n=1 Tax=Caloramator sp. TaxID=1871330 RepID=UPI001D4B3A4C|nr:Na/Pi symporter [Caloramator sp.]MBZ4663328.1 Na/Pi cotransporter family protein [Caloramator sp.]
MKTQIYNLLGGIGLLIFSLYMLSHSSQNYFSSWFHNKFKHKNVSKLYSLFEGIIFSFITESSTISATSYSSILEAGSIDFVNILYFISGVNIGASLIPVIILLNISVVPYLLIFAGTFIVIFVNKNTKKNIFNLGQILLSIGLLFVSLIYIKSGTIESQLIHLIKNNYISSFFIGIIIALIFKSSNAVIILLIPFVQNNIIGFNSALFIIIGANIGSAFYVLFKSYKQERHIIITSFIHLIINITGAFIVYIIYIINPLYLYTTSYVALNIIILHILTNLLGSFISILISNQIIKGLLNNIYPLKTDNSTKRFKYLNPIVTNTPSVAIEQCIKEISRMGEIALLNLEKSFNLIFDFRRNSINQIQKDEDLLDYLEDALMNFLTTLSMKNPTYGESEVIMSLYNMINDMERVGDHAVNLLDLAEYKFNHYVNFSEEASVELKYFFELCHTSFSKALEALKNRDLEKVDEVVELEQKIDSVEKQLRKDHIDRLNKCICNPNSGMIFLDCLTNLERVGDHAYKIALTARDIVKTLQ